MCNVCGQKWPMREKPICNSQSQGLKILNKSARELVQRLQKIDGDNYPETGASWPYNSIKCWIKSNGKQHHNDPKLGLALQFCMKT
ncbi:hypothetical protein Vadar_028095 [Vaccinium darrowii]|uniref:Uncharacterized protein n=1 Tax=Vaccinium darrowii TaxID=229202 RepID=A0ACB7ZN06_9ERIC|nr:hypothetical protein Vadar_028095 [Vaccinium darrowii]